MKVVINGQVVDIEIEETSFEVPAEDRIAELKQKLYETDYMAIKYAEGRLTKEEYAPMGEQREAWRAEINALEAQLNKED